MPRRQPTSAVLALLAVALVALAAASCRPRPAWEQPLRVAELVVAPLEGAVAVAARLEVGPEPVTLPVTLAATGVARLTFRARGDAELVKFSWRLADERRFQPFRALTLPVVPDGEEHVYRIDLRREPYWTGSIGGLRLSTDHGRLEITELTGAGGGASARTTSLGGVTLPSLAGVARLELELPEQARGAADFTTRLGLLPHFRRPGVTAHFRAWLEVDGEDRLPWLDETLSGDEPEGWRRIERRVELPPGARLVLEATASRHGQPLPEGSAVWGAPTLMPPASRRAEGPNVVVVVVDTLRADVLGSYGDDGGLTPHLDGLATQSVRFTDLSSVAPWTLPSVVSMLTGFHPQVHGAGRRIGAFAPTSLGDAPATLPQVLAGHGLLTVGVYNNIYMTPAFGLARGFDEYTWIEEDDDRVMDEALARLETLADRRFFLLVHLFGPHHPYAPPEDFCRQVGRRFAPGAPADADCAARRDDVPTLGGEPPPPADRPWVEALYRAEVGFSDRQLGRLVAALDRLEIADDTVLLVVSDHGEAFWDRLDQQAEHGYTQSDHGHTHFQELVRVPALLRVPGRAPAVIDHPVETVDIFPTLLSLAGVTPPVNQGQDLATLLAGEPPARRTVISDFLLYGASRWSVRRGPWKLVVPEDEALAVELYDLAGDPAESRDVAADHPDVVSALRAYGERELAARHDLRQRLLAGDDDVLQSSYLEWNHITKLRALGYLQ
ncbi:MAG TPA: sulfatase [Thermoanaerobaculia bacterium]|nr:sulfatase [Thermoanaerobaculia bacterium]